MATANPERGEITVELEGVPHVLQPSYQAQVAIEQQTGLSLEQLSDGAGRSAMSIEHMAIIVTECVRAHGRATKNGTLSAYTAERVGECIVESGKLMIAKRLELLLYLAVTGGYRASGELRAPTTPAGPTEPVATAA